MSLPICIVPFCENPKKGKNLKCYFHIREQEKFKVKTYKEFLPLWAKKRCKTHGLLRSNYVYQYGNKCKLCVKDYDKNNPIKQNTTLIKRYGSSFIEYHQILQLQNNQCAICKITLEELKKRNPQNQKSLALDHCHKTNKIRGVLCGKCNIGLGYFDDNPELLEKAAQYLRR